MWIRNRLEARVALGLILGVAGVALLAGVESLHLPDEGGVAIAAALAAAFSYGIATNYAKSAAVVEPFANEYGSMWAATLLLLPLMFATPVPSEPPDPRVVASAVALGVVCSGVAYLLYFRLVADIGPAPALTVTFLVPVFGILWGVLLLGETVGWHTFVGSASVLIGTALATGFSPRAAFAQVGRKR